MANENNLGTKENPIGEANMYDPEVEKQARLAEESYKKRNGSYRESSAYKNNLPERHRQLVKRAKKVGIGDEYWYNDYNPTSNSRVTDAWLDRMEEEIKREEDYRASQGDAQKEDHNTRIANRYKNEGKIMNDALYPDKTKEYTDRKTTPIRTPKVAPVRTPKGVGTFVPPMTANVGVRRNLDGDVIGEYTMRNKK